MSKKSVTKFNANIAAEFKTVFGPPLVHKTADENIYNAILYRLAKDIGPRDFIEQIFLRDLADHVYEIQWLRPFGTVSSGKLTKKICRSDVPMSSAVEPAVPSTVETTGSAAPLGEAVEPQ
jgi:hypothetical protein